MSLASETKVQVRKSLFEQYKNTALDSYTAAALAHIQQHPLFRNAQTVLAYAPKEIEIPFVQELFEAHPAKQWFFPKVNTETRTMQFFSITKWSEMLAGNFDILEPAESAPLWQPGDAIDTICLVPALALSAAGDRLGKGGGYYDRFLGMHKTDLTTISVVPDFAFTNDIPREEHDVRVDFAIEACSS